MAKVKKLVFAIGEHLPFILALALAIWCIFDKRPELGMGYLILGLIYGVWKDVHELRNSMEGKDDEQPQEVEAPRGRHHSRRADH